jgi:O-succinylhomoserine sulfhydrylase
MLKAGDHVVSARALFGSCLYVLDILQRFGVEVTFVDGTDLAHWQAAVRPGTKALFLETVSNPTLEVIDVRSVAAIGHAAGATVIVDNVFATPVFSQAVANGADVVVYSATKHIDGSGRCLGGVVCGSRHYVRKVLEPYLKHTGAALSPFNAWVMLKGMETLDLRVRQQAASADAVARALQGHPKLTRVIYPGLPSHPQNAIAMAQMGSGGTVVSFEVRGGQAAAFRFLNALELIKISNNLGDARSIVTHPATTTHQRLPAEQKAALGITPGLVRLSLGLEDCADVLADLQSALEVI